MRNGRTSPPQTAQTDEQEETAAEELPEMRRANLRLRSNNEREHKQYGDEACGGNANKQLNQW